MGQFAVILTLSALLLSGLMLLNARSATEDAADTLIAYQIDRLAQEIALVGLNDIKRRLNAQPAQWTADTSLADARFRTARDYGGGRYRTRIFSMNPGTMPTGILPGDDGSVTLVATGEYRDFEGNRTCGFIEASYRRGWTSEGPDSMLLTSYRAWAERRGDTAGDDCLPCTATTLPCP